MPWGLPFDQLHCGTSHGWNTWAFGRRSVVQGRPVYIALRLTHCPLMPFGAHIQITVEANVARGYKDTENILVLINLQYMLSDQIYKS